MDSDALTWLPLTGVGPARGSCEPGAGGGVHIGGASEGRAARADEGWLWRYAAVAESLTDAKGDGLAVLGGGGDRGTGSAIAILCARVPVGSAVRGSCEHGGPG